MNWDSVKNDAQAGLNKMEYNLPLYTPARSLSGGNLQRMVIVRELGLDPHLIVASYMTRGLDVQSTIAARQALLDACQAGAGVLLISEDLDEILELSDRIAVMCEGRIVGIVKRGEATPEELGLLMAGVVKEGQGDPA